MSMNKYTADGIIVKAIGGLYYTETSDGVVLQCTARGIFRKREISPCAGDRVKLEVAEDNTALISEIYERRNSIIRPPLANLDRLAFVISTCEPSPNLLLLDKFIAIAEYKSIEPMIVITKVDLGTFRELYDIYTACGITCIYVDYSDNIGRDKLYDQLSGKITAFTGNSGVGKSTLLNHLDSSLGIDTGEISKKLGRGRHTTRHVELYKLPCGGYVADTPGFSTLETQKYDIIRKEALADCFREFADYYGSCRFQDCSHTKENGCGIIAAVGRGDIAKSRHDSYVQMYEEAKKIHEWEIKGKP